MLNALARAVWLVLAVSPCLPAQAETERSQGRFELEPRFASDSSSQIETHPPPAWAMVNDGEDRALQLFAPPATSADAAEMATCLLGEHPLTDYTLGCRVKPMLLRAQRSLRLLCAFHAPDDYTDLRVVASATTYLELGQVQAAQRVVWATAQVDADLLPVGHWQRVKLEHNERLGQVSLYLGDMRTPVFTATDMDWTPGRVGVGSSDTVLHLDQLGVIGTKAPQPAR